MLPEKGSEFFLKEIICSKKCGTVRNECKKRNHKIKLVQKFSKLNIQHPYFETLVLPLHCYCRDNMKYIFLSKDLFKGK